MCSLKPPNKLYFTPSAHGVNFHRHTQPLHRVHAPRRRPHETVGSALPAGRDRCHLVPAAQTRAMRRRASPRAAPVARPPWPRAPAPAAPRPTPHRQNAAPVRSTLPLTLPRCRHLNPSCLAKEKVAAAGQGKSKGGSTSSASKAGLQFPVAALNRYLRKGKRPRVGVGAGVYMGAVLERHLCAEILELAGNAARDNKKTRIVPRHIQLAARNDEELNKLLGSVTMRPAACSRTSTRRCCPRRCATGFLPSSSGAAGCMVDDGPARLQIGVARSPSRRSWMWSSRAFPPRSQASARARGLLAGWPESAYGSWGVRRSYPACREKCTAQRWHPGRRFPSGRRRGSSRSAARDSRRAQIPSCKI